MYNFCLTIIIRSCDNVTVGVPNSGHVLSNSVSLYPLHQAGYPGVDTRLLEVAAVFSPAHNTKLSQPVYLTIILKN